VEVIVVVGVMVLVTIIGVRLTVGEGVVPGALMVGVINSVVVGVPRVFGARERAIKPTQ
jgi:hypothetical protein